MGWRDDIAVSKVLKARHINEASRDLSFRVNGQLSAEIDDTVPYEDKIEKGSEPFEKRGKFTSREVFKPDFFGSPSPRMVADTGVCLYRDTDQDWSKGAVFNSNSTGSGDEAIPGLSASLRLRERSLVNIMASFYCFELGGINFVQQQLADGRTQDDALKNNPNFGYESFVAGRAYISVDGNKKFATERPIHVGLVGTRSWVHDGLSNLDTKTRHGFHINKGELLIPMINRKVYNMHFQTELNAGIHNIGVVYSGQSKTDEPSYPVKNYWYASEGYSQFFGHELSDQVKLPKHKNVFFLSRNFIVDAYAIEDRY